MESPSSNPKFTLREIFGGTTNHWQALVSLLELRFHGMFEQYKNGKIDADKVKPQIENYLRRQLDIFDEVFEKMIGSNLKHFSTHPEQERAFFNHLLLQLRKAEAFINPVRLFVVRKIRPKLSFEEYQLIRHGEHTPKTMRQIMDIISTKSQAEEAYDEYSFLESFTEQDPEALHFLRYLLVKAIMEVCKVGDTSQLTIEHIPMPSKNLVQRLKKIFAGLLKGTR